MKNKPKNPKERNMKSILNDKKLVSIEVVTMALAKMNSTPLELCKYIEEYQNGQFEALYQKAVELKEETLSKRIKEAYDISIKRELRILKYLVEHNGQEGYLEAASVEKLGSMERILRESPIEEGSLEDDTLTDISHAIDFVVAEYIKGEEEETERLKAYVNSTAIDKDTILRHGVQVLTRMRTEKRKTQMN